VQYETKHPAHSVLQSIGKEITGMKPTAVVVFSAHWQAGRNDIEVNSAESTDLVYE
jgi:aromatic ring-opening dioxygenase catalytic subunit (LigB family)